jgi:hypothetical protein
MTYRDEMSTPKVVAAIASPEGRAEPDSQTAGPVVTADRVVFRLPDPHREFDGVRLEVDWMLGDGDREFIRSDGDWTLRIARTDRPTGWPILAIRCAFAIRSA